MSGLPLSLHDSVRERRTVDLVNLSAVPVAPPVIERVLEAANWAPSHGQTEPWRFAVFTGEARMRLSEALATSLALLKGEPQADPEVLRLQQGRQRLAPVWIAVAVEPAVQPRMPLHEEQWAVACAVQNLMLTARSLGLASKWISNPPSLHDATRAALGFGERASMMGVLYLGYPRDEGSWPAGKRRPLAEKVRYFTD